MYKQIGNISNFYGSLFLTQNSEGKYMWGIENWDGIDWEEIPDYLAEALIKFDKERCDAE